MSKLRTALLVGLLAASLAPLYGCGSECAPGTVDQDGQCVVDAKGCAEGTVLKDGECLLDASGCGDGTMLDGALCVPIDTVCEAGTTFDQGNYTCVPNSDVLCGEGTEADGNGVCVSNADACADKTNLNEDGLCVVDAAACGPGTQLDPNSGDCLLAETACGQGTAFDADNGVCVPTAEVCDMGTRFDAASGLCLPDSCSAGDVIVDGTCTSIADHLASDPDMGETENNDPALGGAANSLLVPAAGDDPFVFTGTIEAASDIDGDGTLDQDIDVFQFDANAGEWFEIAVLSTGIPEPAFKVEGPNGYVRWSPLGGGGATRDIVIPEDGTYMLTVLPALVLQTEGDVDRIGGDDWSYVGTLEVLSAPSPAQVDLSAGAGQLAGDFPDLSDNYFEMTGAQAGDVVNLSVDTLGADARGIVQVWSDPTTLEAIHPLQSGGNVQLTATGSATSILVDWISTDGPNVAFDLSARINGSNTVVTLQPGASHTVQVTAQAYDQIIASQTNPTSAELDVIFNEVATATEVESTTLASGDEVSPIITNAGDYEVVFTNNTSASVDATLVATARPITSAGTVSTGSPATYAHPSTITAGEILWLKVTLNDPGVINLSGPHPGGDMNFGLFDPTLAALDNQPYTDSEFSYTYGTPSAPMAAGTYFISAEALVDVPSLEVTIELLELPSQNASSPGAAIPDDDPVGIEDMLTVSGCATISDIRVFTFIEHTFRGDLIITLTHPNGSDSVQLAANGFDSTENYLGWFPTDYAVSGPGALSDFAGLTGNGDWTLSVSDNAGWDTGTLEMWALDLTCQ